MKKMKITMKHKISSIFLFILILTSTSLSSCKKWLELKPEDGLIEQDYWQTKEQLKSAVMGAYASLLNPNLTKYLFMWGELRADMVNVGFSVDEEENLTSLSNLRKDQLSLIRTEIDARNSITNWKDIYLIINICNDVIKNAEKVLITDKTITREQVNEYLAEVHGLRGLMYFYLLRTFGEVPLKIEPTNNDTDIVPLQKSSQEAVTNHIIKDLKFAAEYAVNTYGTMADDRGRITSFTAYTILADVYLWDEKYAESIAACDKVIESGRYRLLPEGITQTAWANNVYKDGNSIESVFEFQFDDQVRNPFFSMFSISQKDFQAKDWIQEGELFGVDFNDSDNRDIRGNGTSYNEANGNITKFTLSRTDATSTSNWMVYKFADVLLMKAEALTWLEKGNVENGTAAIEIVQDLRRHRNALDFTPNGQIEIPNPVETKKISDFILEERAREFAFEGKRWYDILRHAKRNSYENLELLISIASANSVPSKQQIVINKYKDLRSHYLPFYYTELQTNKSLIQNPFY